MLTTTRNARAVSPTPSELSRVWESPTWGRHVPCQPQATIAKPFRLGPHPPVIHGEQPSPTPVDCLRHSLRVIPFNLRGKLVADARSEGDGDLSVADRETGLLQFQPEG